MVVLQYIEQKQESGFRLNQENLTPSKGMELLFRLDDNNRRLYVQAKPLAGAHPCIVGDLSEIYKLFFTSLVGF